MRVENLQAGSTITENGQRVYSPNNNPTAGAVGAYTKAETDAKYPLKDASYLKAEVYTKSESNANYLGKTANAVSASSLGNTNLNKTFTSLLTVPNLNWWGDVGIGHSQMVRPGNGWPSSGPGYVFKIGARDAGKGHAWIGMTSYADGGKLVFGATELGSEAPKWDTVYSNRNKPTWHDVGGESWFKVGKVASHIQTALGKWNIASDSTHGWMPSETGTGTSSKSYLGSSDWWFKEAWSNSFRGGSVDVTGEVKGGSIRSNDFRVSEDWSEGKGNSSFLKLGVYDAGLGGDLLEIRPAGAEADNKTAGFDIRTTSNNSNTPLLEWGKRVYSPNNKPTAAEIQAKPASWLPTWNDVSSKPAQATRWPTWNETSGKPTTFTPAAHTHPWGQVTGVPTYASRWPKWGEVTDKPTKYADSSKLNGLSNSTAATGNTIAQRDASGDITVRGLHTQASDENAVSGSMAFRVNNSSDSSVRFCNDPDAVRAWTKSVGKDSNQVMTGVGSFINFQYPADSHGYLLGTRGGVSDWYVGRGSSSATQATFYNYKGDNGINLGDNKSNYYNAGSGGSHIFNGSANFEGDGYFKRDVIIGEQSYPSVNLLGNKGITALLELDSINSNISISTRANNTSTDRKVWGFHDDGKMYTPVGIQIRNANGEGTGGYTVQHDTKAPFLVDTLTNANGTSTYYPAIKWNSKPTKGKWLTSSIGHLQDSNNITGTVITSVDAGGADLKVWVFNRAGDATGAGKWVDTSDRRCKENIKDLISTGESAMSMVNSFTAKAYNYIGGSASYGFIAQDVQKVLPDAITESYDESLGTKLGLHYGSVTALHHEALKELEVKLEEVIKENGELKARLVAIEAKLGL